MTSSPASPNRPQMVSQPDTERTLVRRPPSAVSRATSSRRHRYNQSHAGAASHHHHHSTQNDFPFFSYTGDVEIIIKSHGQEKKYLLHRLILAQCSGFFEESTSEQCSRAQAQLRSSQESAGGLSRITENEAADSELVQSSSAPTANGGMRWRYELDWHNTEDGDTPILIQKDPNSSSFFPDSPSSRPPPVRNKPPTPQSGFFRSMANLTALSSTTHLPSSGTPADRTIRDYDNLFRIFYNYPPTLDAVNIAGSYAECKSLLGLAEIYDALEVIGPRVDHHMLRFGRQLFKQIAKYPPSYLKLGYLARSKIIFSEALIHVVGQWPAGANQLNNSLPDLVLDIIEDKVEEIEDMKSKVESKLFRLTLTTSRGERVTPHNAYLDWLAVSLFRQWLAENTTPPPAPILKHRNANGTSSHALPPPPPKFNTGKIYRLIGTGGTAYLAHDETKKFLKLRPDDYSRDALKKFERRMDEIKHLAQDIVKPLMRNSLELDLGRDGGGLGYLTCTKVLEADYPWDI